ncbi:helix-turn-helix domain-containing protein [Shewanella japonica]|uniref:Transcriptional regulator n=1 Tax=Shewanella japonica TaxID=93973 RepID=A0ABM6JI88_9GAMM|nr:Transcriptional regulator [Shewanella japonica]
MTANRKAHAVTQTAAKKATSETDVAMAPVRHSNATTTPEMRQFIQTSDFSVSQLAKILNISEATVRKWRKRDSISDTPNTPHHLKTTLSPMEEYVVVGLRYQLKMSLDRLLHVTQQFINPNVSRSGLARCLKRYGISKLDEFESPHVPECYFNQLPIVQGTDVATYTLNPETLAKTLALPEATPDNVVQVVSLTIPPQLTQADSYSILLGVDFATDWVYLDIYQDNHTQATNRYIAYVLKHGPFHLRKLLVKNYHTFLARFPGATVLQSTEAANQKNKSAKDQLNTGDSK